MLFVLARVARTHIQAQTECFLVAFCDCRLAKGELKGAANPSGLFTGGGANGDVFSNMWQLGLATGRAR